MSTSRPSIDRYRAYDAGDYFRHVLPLLCPMMRKHGWIQTSAQRFQFCQAYKVPLQHAIHWGKGKVHIHFTQCFVATAAAVWLALACTPASAAPEIGKAAPTLVVTELDGSTFDLAKLRGKVVLVNYWATWCAPCRKEMPKLEAFYRRYHDSGLEIIAISIDFPRDADKARKMARTFTYPAALLQTISDNGFGEQKAVPFTWVIDADGNIRDMMIDVRDELLDGIVVPLLPH